MTIYGYARCSTDEEQQDINRQIRELVAMGVPEENIFNEYESGMKYDRKELKRLLGILQQGDALYATELSRITRSTKDLISLIDTVKEKRVKLVLGNFVCDCSSQQLDAMTEGMIKMMGVFAELERNIISERVKSGLKNAKAKGKIVGRPTLTMDKIPKRFITNYYPRIKNKEITKTEVSKIEKWSRNTIDKYIRVIEG